MIPVVMKLGGELKKKLMPSFLKLRKFLKDIIPRVKDLVKHFAKKLQPAFKSVKRIAESLGKVFGGLISDMGNSEDAFASLTSIVNVVADVLNWLADVIADVVDWFAQHPTITKFAIAIAAAVALITSPILAIIAALAVLAVAWDNDWLGIKTTTLMVTDAIGKIIGDFLDAVTAFWDAHGEAILKTVSFIWDAIKLYIGLAMASIRTVISLVMALIRGDWEGAWDALKTYVDTVFGLIDGFIGKWGEDLEKAFTTIVDGAIALLIGGFNSVLGAVKAIANWISSNGFGLWDPIIKATAKLKEMCLDKLFTVFASIKTWFIEMKSIEFSWPTIPNPFEGIDFCAYIPDWFAKWMGICGAEPLIIPETPIETPPTISGGGGSSSSGSSCSKGCDHRGGPDSTSTGSGTPTGGAGWTLSTDGPDLVIKGTYDSGSGGSGGGSSCDKGSSCSKGCDHRGGGATGGFVQQDTGLNVHAGEYIIPVHGTPVVEGRKSDVNITINYNIDKVTGVNDFERMLNKHDQEMLRKIRSLV